MAMDSPTKNNMPRIIPTILCDFYKVSHAPMMKPGTTTVYETWTARTSRIEGVNKTVVFGLQMFLKEWLINFFNKEFFEHPLEEVVAEYKRFIKFTLGAEPDAQHIVDLHNLGYMPLEFCSLPEGVECPIRVPQMTVRNTDDDKFAWLVGYIETLFSCEDWQGTTSATIALRIRRLLDSYAQETSAKNLDFVQFQGHDFSMRGMSSVSTAIKSGLGHLLSFTGTDTMPAIQAAEIFYNANIEKELVGTSIPASEHAIQCSYGDDMVYFRRLINEVHPSGFVSIVSDGYDFWDVISRVLPELKDEIMARSGGPLGDKVVIRPDSGDPVDIVCGKAVTAITAEDFEQFQSWAADMLHDTLCTRTPHGEYGGDIEELFSYDSKVYKVKYAPDWNRYDKQYYFIENFGSMVSRCTFEEINLTTEESGAVQSLWDIFGGTINEQGYKELDPHIGLIYGDAITYDRAKEICERLKAKGFASTNIVFGIGSFTYQYNTRDTFGHALKSTFNICDGKPVMIFKDPKTDDGTKKSLKGRVAVFLENGEYVAKDGYDHLDPIEGDQLVPVFRDGKLLVDHSLAEIRQRLRG